MCLKDGIYRDVLRLWSEIKAGIAAVAGVAQLESLGLDMPVVKLYANLRKLAGTKEFFVTGATLEAALKDLIQRHPPLGEVLLEEGKLRPHVVVTLNGQNLVSLDAPVVEQDVIAIFPPIAGGSLIPTRRARVGVIRRK